MFLRQIIVFFLLLTHAHAGVAGVFDYMSEMAEIPSYLWGDAFYENCTTNSREDAMLVHLASVPQLTCNGVTLGLHTEGPVSDLIDNTNEILEYMWLEAAAKSRVEELNTNIGMLDRVETFLETNNQDDPEASERVVVTYENLLTIRALKDSIHEKELLIETNQSARQEREGQAQDACNARGFGAPWYRCMCEYGFDRSHGQEQCTQQHFPGEPEFLEAEAGLQQEIGSLEAAIRELRIQTPILMTEQMLALETSQTLPPADTFQDSLLSAVEQVKSDATEQRNRYRQVYTREEELARAYNFTRRQGEPSAISAAGETYTDHIQSSISDVDMIRELMVTTDSSTLPAGFDFTYAECMMENRMLQDQHTSVAVDLGINSLLTVATMGFSSVMLAKTLAMSARIAGGVAMVAAEGASVAYNVNLVANQQQKCHELMTQIQTSSSTAHQNKLRSEHASCLQKVSDLRVNAYIAAGGAAISAVGPFVGQAYRAYRLIGTRVARGDITAGLRVGMRGVNDEVFEVVEVVNDNRVLLRSTSNPSVRVYAKPSALVRAGGRATINTARTADEITEESLEAFGLTRNSYVYRTMDPQYLDEAAQTVRGNPNSVALIENPYAAQSLDLDDMRTTWSRWAGEDAADTPIFPEMVNRTPRQSASTLASPGLNVMTVAPTAYSQSGHVLIRVRVGDILDAGGRVYDDVGAAVSTPNSRALYFSFEGPVPYEVVPSP